MGKKFTFKTTQPTGRHRSFDVPYHDIKYNKIEVGHITHPKGSNPKHQAKFMVRKTPEEMSQNPNCEWRWITLRHSETDIKTMKKWIRDHTDQIMERFDIYLEE